MKSTGEEDFSSKLLKRETKSCLQQKKNLNVRFGSINSTPQQDSHTSLLLQISLLSVFNHMSATHWQDFKEVGRVIIAFLETFIIYSKLFTVSDWLQSPVNYYILHDQLALAIIFFFCYLKECQQYTSYHIENKVDRWYICLETRLLGQ